MPVSSKKVAAKKVATSKPAGKPAAKKVTTTALVPWAEEMKAKAKIAAEAEKIQQLTKKIGTRGGILTVDDEAVEGNELSAVVLVAVHENQYYKERFDPKNPTVPNCYSFGDPASADPEPAMAPHDEAEDKQGDDDGLCANCWANQWKSADEGNGKACKNIRRLALITPDALESAEDLESAEVRMLNVPVMSTRNWSKFVHKMAEMERPYWTVVCKIKLVPDEASQFRIEFSFDELINFDSDTWLAMQSKITEVSKSIVAPYPKQADLNAERPVRPQGRLAQKMAQRSVVVKKAAKTLGAKSNKKF